MADLAEQLADAQAECGLLGLALAGAERDHDLPGAAVAGAHLALRRISDALELAESQLRVNDQLRRTMVPRASNEGTGSQPSA